MRKARVLGPVKPGLPALAAVGGAEDQVEGADDKAVRFVFEPDVEKGLVGALLDETFEVFVQACTSLAPSRPLGRGMGGVITDHDLGGGAAVKLLHPGDAAVGTVQHHAVMTDRPAFLRCRKMDGHQIGTDRHLAPGSSFFPRRPSRGCGRAGRR